MRFFEIIAPGNFDNYFAEIAPFFPQDKEPEFDKLIATAARYGLDFDMTAAESTVKKY